MTEKGTHGDAHVCSFFVSGTYMGICCFFFVVRALSRWESGTEWNSKLKYSGNKQSTQYIKSNDNDNDRKEEVYAAQRSCWWNYRIMLCVLV